jgi:hypothetical protein
VEARNGSHDPARKQEQSLEDLQATVVRPQHLVCELLVENQSLRFALFTGGEIVGESAATTVRAQSV